MHQTQTTTTLSQEGPGEPTKERGTELESMDRYTEELKSPPHVMQKCKLHQAIPLTMLVVKGLDQAHEMRRRR